MKLRPILSLMLFMMFPLCLAAQDGQQELAPVTRTYALTHVNIIQSPGRKIDMGTVIIQNGLIKAVGKGLAIPPEAIVIKADSMYVYAGFIDGMTRAGVNRPKEENQPRPKDPGNPTPERAGITPANDVRYALNPADKSMEELRNLGFTTLQVVPYGNLLPGHSSIVLPAGKTADDMILVGNNTLYSELTGAQGVYPLNLLGVMATWRDLYRKAVNAKNYETLYASNRSGLERPVSDRNLEAFYPVIDQRVPVLFRTERLLDVSHVLNLKKDLGFTAVVADVKDGWPIINTLKASGAKTFLSLDLPEEVKKDDKKKDAKKESGSAAGEAEKQALEKRKADAIQAYAAQAGAFQKAGVVFGFASISAKSKDIPANLRRMIAAGLTEDAALAALTTNPAQMLGLSDRMGTIDNGKMANLVVSDKSYFNEKAKVRYVFVDGKLFKMDVKDAKKADPNAKVDIEGTWSTITESPQAGRIEGKYTFKKEGSGYTGKASGGRLPAPVDLSDVSLDGNTLTFKYSISFGSNNIAITCDVTVEGDSFKGSLNFGQGTAQIEGTKDPKN